MVLSVQTGKCIQFVLWSNFNNTTPTFKSKNMMNMSCCSHDACDLRLMRHIMITTTINIITYCSDWGLWAHILPQPKQIPITGAHILTNNIKQEYNQTKLFSHYEPRLPYFSVESSPMWHRQIVSQLNVSTSWHSTRAATSCTHVNTVPSQNLVTTLWWHTKVVWKNIPAAFHWHSPSHTICTEYTLILQRPEFWV